MKGTSVKIGQFTFDVDYDIETYEREPYSWGEGRGFQTDVLIYSIKLDEKEIIELLSEKTIEEIEEEIKIEEGLC